MVLAFLPLEQSSGSAEWVLRYKRPLEDVPMWMAVVLNLFFIVFFEEHGPAAEVCLPSGAWLDFGTICHLVHTFSTFPSNAHATCFVE